MIEGPIYRLAGESLEAWYLEAVAQKYPGQTLEEITEHLKISSRWEMSSWGAWGWQFYDERQVGLTRLEAVKRYVVWISFGDRVYEGKKAR